MTHDPLCPELWRWSDGQPCMFCALITRVREDERTNGDERDPLNCTHSYKKAIRDALAAIAAIPKEDGGYCHVLHACDVEAAIEALNGER